LLDIATHKQSIYYRIERDTITGALKRVEGFILCF